MDEEKRKLLEKLMRQADPELLEKFGNPLNEDDPRNWSPSVRRERGLPDSELLRLLEVDMEAAMMTIAKLVSMVMEQREFMEFQMKKELLEAAKRDPEKVVQALLGNVPQTKGSYGPFDDDPDTAVRYAGSTDGGIAPDRMVDTPNGMIRADQIPGYRDDPNWRPSPDWVEANCTCDAHTRLREQANSNQKPDNDFPTGFYL